MKLPSESTILIVDDEADLRNTISFDFLRKGYNVLTASSGNGALKILSEKKVDLILSDVRMADGDGIELLNQVKSNNKTGGDNPVVIFITAISDLSLNYAFEHGVDAVFPKPFDRVTLFDAVIAALQEPPQNQQRKKPRVNYEAPVHIAFPKKQTNIESVATNIGLNGFFVPMPAPLPEVRDECDFFLQADANSFSHIHGKGIVRWVRAANENSAQNLSAGCGIEFAGLDENYQFQLLELINYIKTKSHTFKT
jgi:CheY-like chemotaxis protein